MGWKISGALAFDGPEGYLGTCPEHNSDAARELLTKLGYKIQDSKGMVELLTALNPSDGHVSIGAFEHATLVSFAIDVNTNLEEKLFFTYPDWEVFSFYTVSSACAFGYSFFQHGQKVRGLCSCDGKIVEDVGEVLPQERVWFDKSFVRDGVRYVRHDQRNLFGEYEWALHNYGEELIGLAAVPYFGCMFFPPKPARWTNECHPSMMESGELTQEEFGKLANKLSRPHELPELELFKIRR